MPNIIYENNVYAIISVEYGSYIGHGLYEEHEQILSIHKTKDGAQNEADRIKQEEGIDCSIKTIDVEQ